MNRKQAWLAAALVLGAGTPHGRAAGIGAAGDWDRSVVGVEISRKQFDYSLPWAKRSRPVTKSGVLIGPREILTTADDLDAHTLARVQKGGRGQWSTAEIKWIDFPANLALLTCADETFWTGLKPVSLADSLTRGAELNILRWRAGNLESRRAEFNRFTAQEGRMSDAIRVVLEVGSEIDGVGWGEPVISGRRLVGIVIAQSGNQKQIMPAPFIRSILEAQRKGIYRGLGFFEFVWQPAENPETLAYLQLAGAKRGVVVIDVPARPGATPLLKPRDILLQVDGFDIDTQGDYVDSVYGHLSLENLSTRNKWAGDPVRLKIWRDGREMDVVYTLPRAEEAARLVPEAPFGQEPEYLIVGGLVFQPLTKNYLRSWGQDWERRAPFRLAYFRNESPTPERPALVLLSQVLPDQRYNLGYQDSRSLVLERVNGKRVSYLEDVQQALKTPTNGFHLLEFMKGESLQRIVLDAEQEAAATARVLEQYRIEKPFFIAPRS